VLEASFIRVRAPQPFRSARFHLGTQAVGADVAVAVERPAAAETDHMNHAIAVERVVELLGRVNRILRVAQVHAVEVGRNLTRDHLEVVGVPLADLRAPGTGPVRVVVVFRQGRQDLADQLDIHGGSSRP
jgi:hypothetical protein